MNLNEYFANSKFFKNKIIVISAKNEASRKIKRFLARDNLKLKMEMSYRNSYIAVVDNKRDFVYEKTDKKLQECSYQVKNKYIDIISAGFDAGDRSSIKIGDAEYSNNRRGLNIAIFHYRTLALIDKFYLRFHQ